MFLSAVAVPMYYYNRKSYFDGRIGLWPFVQHTEAKRSSKNIPKGAPVIDPLNVDKNVYRRFIIEKVFLAIQSNFPTGYGPYVEIQQDNAKTWCWKDSIVQEPYRSRRWKIKIVNQPAS